MENVTRTVYGSALQTAQYSKLPFNLIQNTTLNEKFNIQSGIAPSEMPTVGYYCIGNGGHKFQSGIGGVALIKSLEHKATDAALFSHLPFVLRAVNNDLTLTQRAKYALRKQVTINSVDYIAYYLKRIDTSAAVIAMKLQTTNNGTTSTSSFVPTAGNLSPTPTEITNSGVNPLQGQYAIVSSTLGLTLTADECQEILNAAAIIYGDEGYAVISEIGLCSGVDKVISLPGGDSFTEAIAVQVTSHIGTFHSVQAARTGIAGTLELGSAEPMLTLSA